MRRELSLLAVAFVLGAVTGALAVAGLAPEPPAPSPAEAQAPTEPVAPAAADPDPQPEPAAALALAPVAEAGPPAADAPAPDPLQIRLEEMRAGWTRMEDEVTRLSRRIADLEQRLAAVQGKPAAALAAGPPRLSATPDGQRSALVQAGLADEAATELIRRQGEQSLARLDLRDIAAREGWLGTDRYREEVARLDEGNVDLREELGDEVYDRYLYTAGEDNRVRVDGIIPGSVGEMAGLQPGDLVETYAGEPVFTFSDLREATTGGERGELVQVRVRRGTQTFEAWVARGPLGVQLDSARAEPR